MGNGQGEKPEDAYRFRLRPEARPTAYKRLSQNQRRAYDTLAGMLGEAVHELPREGSSVGRAPHPTEVQLDFQRRARVALLSGDRGAGKTTVLLSLLNDIQRFCRSDEGSRNASHPDGLVDGAIPKSVEPLANRIVWLDILDMAPMPALTQLFSAILVRIEEAAGRLRGLRGDPNRYRVAGSQLATDSEYEDPLAQLERLQRDVAVSWEGNLLQRRGAMDAEQFASEVRRSEYTRLQLDRKLSLVLDRLARTVDDPCGSIRNPLFVLPVDDCDLNPPRCLQVLELLRTLSVPRLFFVVLGRAEMAEQMLRLEIAGRMATTSRGRTSWLDEQRMRETVASVARDTLRKLLPPAQRVHLVRPRLDEVLASRPLSPDDGTRTGRNRPATMEEQLGKISIPLSLLAPNARKRFPPAVGKGDPTLHEFLFAGSAPPQSSKRSGGKTKAGASQSSSAPDGFYHARHFLRMPYREVIDFWFLLQEAADSRYEPPFERFLRLMNRYCRDIIAGEDAIPAEVREHFLDVFDADPDEEWRLSLDPFRLLPGGLHQQRTIELAKVVTNSGTISRTINVQAARGWDCRTGASAYGGEPRVLPASTTDPILFYTDLVAIARKGIQNALLYHREWALRLASVTYEYETAEGIRGTVEFAWPAPPLLTFWEADRFMDAWSAVIENPATLQPLPLIDLVFHWIDIGCAVLSGSAPLAIAEGDALPSGELGRKLAALINGQVGPQRPDPVRDWILGALSLLSRDIVGEDDGTDDTLKYFSGGSDPSRLPKELGGGLRRGFAKSMREYAEYRRDPELRPFWKLYDHAFRSEESLGGEEKAGQGTASRGEADGLEDAAGASSLNGD